MIGLMRSLTKLPRQLVMGPLSKLPINTCACVCICIVWRKSLFCVEILIR